jgi:hypothetical protein
VPRAEPIARTPLFFTREVLERETLASNSGSQKACPRDEGPVSNDWRDLAVVVNRELAAGAQT